MGCPRLDIADPGFSLDINGIKYVGDKSEILKHGKVPMSSAAFFERAINQLPFDYSNMDVCREVQRKIGVGTTVWGIKKTDEGFKSELYFFYPYDNTLHKFDNVIACLEDFVICDRSVIPDLGEYHCISIDIDSVPSSHLNIYYLDHADAKGVVASSWDLNCSLGVKEKKNTYFAGLTKYGFSEAGFSFAKSYSSVVDILSRYFPGNENSFLSFAEGLKFALCRGTVNAPVGCAVKGSALGLYYMGLDVEEFILFLLQMGFPKELIDTVRGLELQLSHLKFDVGIDIAFSDNKIRILKSSFFGAL